MYKFKFAIGDWSDDGHGKCEYFTVESNKTIEKVRELHYQIKDKTKINIEELCSEYEDSTIRKDDYFALKKLGFDFSLGRFDDDKDNACCYPEGFVRLWIFLLMQVDESLQIEVIDDYIPMFQFYGYDNKSRHIGFVGYGLF